MSKMSVEQRNWIVSIVQNIVRITLVITAYLCTTIFMDIRSDIRKLTEDVSTMKERLIVVEVKLQESFKRTK